LCRHAGSPVAAQQTSSLPSRQPSTHRTPTVSLATPAIGGFGHNPSPLHPCFLRVLVPAP
ncbi:MAG: hypothetical protein FWF43_04085, partial [Propionibacteriaceae bacterium]|nr:hypothetical protein [Propionibacteriaceae bacterium]